MQVLYNVIILPVRYIIEAVFTIMNAFFGHAGYAVIALSMVISILVLPLYMRADAIQAKERDVQKKMEKWMSHIRGNFSGDERYMMLNAYYSEQGYKPLYALKGSIPLLLQIPFFLAAYDFLSNLELLRGLGFGPIKDMGAEDAMFSIGGIAVNVLPVLMTFINLISTAVYTKGFKWKDRVQPVLLALVFLVLLYRSPSGLVLYWTMNNLFSLVKNIVNGLVKNKKRFSLICRGAAAFAYAVFTYASGKITACLNSGDREALLMYGLVFFIIIMPLFKLCFEKVSVRFFKKRGSGVQTEKKTDAKAVLFTEASLTLFLGAVIPLMAVASAPLEFVNVLHYRSPLEFIFFSVCVYAGIFLLWGSIIFFMADENGRKMYLTVLIIVFAAAVADMIMLKPERVDFLTQMLVWRSGWPHFELTERLKNILILAVIAAVIFILKDLITRFAGTVFIAVFMASVIFMIYKSAGINRALATMEHLDYQGKEKQEYCMSAEGNNVMVIMLDAAVGSYFPYLLEYRPELKEKFDGFTYYPNTTSMGIYTNMGSPALYGGYEYTPDAINERTDVTLREKHNEALKLMPQLFEDEGYDVTVCDLPYVNYNEASDYSIYDGMDKVNAFHLKDTLYSMYSWEEVDSMMERNFVFYGLYKAAPAFLQDEIYDEGQYLRADRIINPGYKEDYVKDELAMRWFVDNTEFSDDKGDTLLVYCNEMTHDPVHMQLPDLVINEYTDNSDYFEGVPMTIDGRTMEESGTYYDAVEHFQVNLKALILLGEWFDKMREAGVYDNTRIVIAADHGRNMRQFEVLLLDDGTDLEAVNALLLYKDFNAEGLHTDDTFMTNADTPSLAFEGIVKDAVNPFTGNMVDMSGKENGVKVLYSGASGMLEGNRFPDDKAKWYHVKDDIFDKDKWERISQ